MFYSVVHYFEVEFNHDRFCMFFFLVCFCLQQSFINMGIFPSHLTFPGCFTNIGQQSTTNSIFSNITPKTGTQLVHTKVLVRFWRQCIPLNAQPDFNLYNQKREACTAIKKKFDDIKMLNSEHNMCGDRSRITFSLY